jgi:hypothetical protein
MRRQSTLENHLPSLRPSLVASDPAGVCRGEILMMRRPGVKAGKVEPASARIGEVTAPLYLYVLPPEL